jgi:hypothetical protein
MQKQTRRFAIMVGGGLLSITGIVVGACSTDNGTTNQTPGFDAGKDGKTGGDDGSVNPGEDGSTTEDAGPDCSAAPKPPNKDHPPGPFCFSAADGGCDTQGKDEVCCSDAKYPDGGFAPPQCAKALDDVQNGGYKSGACTAAFAGTVDGGLEFHCTEASHCPNSGEKCCVIAGFVGTPQAQQNKDFPGCQTYFNSGNPAFVGGTRCEKTACKAGELTLCSKDADCTAGKCLPIKLANRFTGVCIVSQ